jgi:hypothetical protein
MKMKGKIKRTQMTKRRIQWKGKMRRKEDEEEKGDKEEELKMNRTE